MSYEASAIMPDGVSIPYRLDGCSKPNAPLIALSNPILVGWSIWDDFISTFSAMPQNANYRFLRYETRGRSNNGGSNPVTVDLLADDLMALLDAVGVPKAAGLIGISLGGVTVLNAALKYPDRIATVIMSDAFAMSPPNNPIAWDERIAMARQDKDAPEGPDGTRLIGENLAVESVKRWFSPRSFDGGLQESRIQAVKNLVYNNSLDGFSSTVRAIYSFDLREKMKTTKVPGIFIIGQDDKPLLLQMTKMAEGYGNGAKLHIIEDAGHIPVVEQPEKFTSIVTSFLADSSAARGI
ncbi:Alpha/Beta hydrolase protein [Xylogone sp. PMI_703]|nr:Alpha/Beta hydrolase protein [Xylogone sp. PMI_703]